MLNNQMHDFFQENHIWNKSYWCACEALPKAAVWGGGIHDYLHTDFFFIWLLNIWCNNLFKKLTWCIQLYIFFNFFFSLFFCFCRSSTHSMCSRCSASSSGRLISIIFMPYVYLLSLSSPSVSHFMRPGRWACYQKHTGIVTDCV